MNGKYVEPIKQVLSESALADEVAQIAICRGQHAQVDTAAAGRTRSEALPLLERSQQLDLHGQGNVRYFVETVPPSASASKPVRALRAPVKAPADVAEQSTLNQVRVQAGDVNRQKGAVMTRTVPVNRPGRQFFPGPTFPRDEHASGFGCYQGDPSNTACMAGLSPTISSSLSAATLAAVESGRPPLGPPRRWPVGRRTA